jgi:Ca2+-dependent lipid-binding protein
MGPATSDPYVVLTCNELTFTSKVKDATLEPVWNESTHFVVGGPRGDLEVQVFDHDLIGTDDLLGKVTIPLSTVKTLAASTGQDRQWFALSMPVEEGGTGEAGGKGEIQLALDLLFDATATAASAEPEPADNSWSLFGGGSAAAAGSGGAAASSGGGGFMGTARSVSGSMSFEQRKNLRARGGSKREFESGSNSKGASGKQGAPSGEARKKAAAEAAKEQARLATLNSKIMSGDWQVQVHVVEVRDLKGEDLSGSCDPVVYMQVLDQKQNSSIKEQTRSAVYDEIFFFDFRNVGRDELSVGNLKVSGLQVQ